MTFSKEGLLQASEDAPWVDVAVVGGGLTGLSCALALLRVDPTLKVQVFERRPEPSGTYGGAVRLEANGLKAAEALSRGLAADIRANGVSAAQMMFHDMEAGTIITRLSPSVASLITAPTPTSKAPTPTNPTARQHAPLVIGWAELEAILEQQLPEGTVQWGTNLVGYSDVGSHVVLQLTPSQASLGHPTGDVAGEKGPRSNTGWLPVVGADGTAAAGEDDTTAGVSGDGTAAAGSSGADEEGDVSAHHIEPTQSDMELTKDQDTGLAASLFKAGPGATTGATSTAATDADQEEGAGSAAAEGEVEGDGGSIRLAATTPDDPVDPQPLESDQPVAPVSPGDAPVTPTSSSTAPRLRPIHTSAAGSPRPAGASSSRPATPLGSTGYSPLPHPHQQAQEAAAAAAPPVQLVRAGLVLAADGAFSGARQEVLLEAAAPTFDGTLRWVGRLPGNLMATTPVEYEAWWLAPGKAFTSHPLRNGDVAWEALVSTDMLASLGWQYNPATGLLERTAQYNTPDQQEGTAGAAAGGSGWGGAAAAPVTPAGSTAGTPRRGAAPAAAPAGVMEAGASPGTPFSSSGTKFGGFGSSSASGAYGATKGAVGEAGAQLEGAAATSAAGGADKTDMAEALTALLSSFPAPVRNMVAHTPPEVLLASSVYIRPARAMPAALGKGRLALVGEAARPLRPSGQEASQALEDAASLGAAIMSHGASVEMLRRFELGRRRRWVHVTQVSMALAACSNLGGLGLHQGVVDYYTDLHNVSFTPLRRIKKPRQGAGALKRLARGVAGGLLAYGGVAAAAGGLRAARGRVDSGKVDKRVVRAVEVAGDALEVVLQAPGQGLQVAGKVVQHSGKVAAAAERKVTGAVVGAMGSLSGTSTEHPVVYGDIPSEGEGAGTKVKRWAVNRAVGAATVASKPVVGVVSDTLGHRVAKALGAF